MGELTVQDNIHTEIKKVRKQIRKMPNWKYPGPDGVQGYWIKNLKKGIQKGNLVSNFRLIICLPLIWKLKNKFITMGTKWMQERKPRHKRSTTN